MNVRPVSAWRARPGQAARSPGSATHAMWLLMAFVTGLTFVLYWGDAPQLLGTFLHR